VIRKLFPALVVRSRGVTRFQRVSRASQEDAGGGAPRSPPTLPSSGSSPPTKPEPPPVLAAVWTTRSYRNFYLLSPPIDTSKINEPSERRWGEAAPWGRARHAAPAQALLPAAAHPFLAWLGASGHLLARMPACVSARPRAGSEVSACTV